MSFVLLVVPAHVPTYPGGCVENCCSVTKDYKISQAFYLRGTGGIEVHCSADDCPFTFNELLDVDAVFRDKVDQSTYQIVLGCGGCVSSQDLVVVPPLKLKGYQDYTIEPFVRCDYPDVLT